MAGLSSLVRLIVALVAWMAAGAPQHAGSAEPVIATPIGVGARYQLPAQPPPVRAGEPVQGMTCAGPPARPWGAVHVELFVDRRALLLPAGIGVGRGGCRYPVSTFDHTGVVLLGSGGLRLASLFAVWGQPLTADRLASGRGSVAAYVDGRRWRGPIGAIPLREHREIVLEVGGRIPPHRFYLFPAGAA